MMTTTAVIDMVSSCLSSFHTGRHSVEWELYFVCGVMCPSVAFHWAKHVFVGELINKLICGPPTHHLPCGADCCSIYTSFTAAMEGELYNLPERRILVLRLLMSTKSYLLKLRCPTNLHDFLSLGLGCSNSSSKGYFAVVYTSP